MKKKIVLIASVACLIYLISVNFTLLFPPTGTIEELAATDPNFAMFKRENIKKMEFALYGSTSEENIYYNDVGQKGIDGLFNYLSNIELEISENTYLGDLQIYFRLKESYDYYRLDLYPADQGTYLTLTYRKQTFEKEDQYHLMGLFMNDSITYDDLMKAIGII